MGFEGCRVGEASIPGPRIRRLLRPVEGRDVSRKTTQEDSDSDAPLLRPVAANVEGETIWHLQVQWLHSAEVKKQVVFCIEPAISHHQCQENLRIRHAGVPGCKQWGQEQTIEEVWLWKLRPMLSTPVQLLCRVHHT